MALADIITSLRTLANDTPTANSIRQETPLGALDGSNKYFRLQNYPVVAGSVLMTTSASFRSATGFTVDLVNGIITYTAAPAANAKPFEADYNYYWFSDTDHTEFLNRGAETLGFGVDPTTVPVGLISSMLHYALHHFWERRAAQYAHRYASSGGAVGHSVDVVTKAFKALSDKALADAVSFRDDFYKKQGRRANPSSGVTSYGIDPYTPIR